MQYYTYEVTYDEVVRKTVYINATTPQEAANLTLYGYGYNHAAEVKDKEVHRVREICKADAPY